MLWYEFYSETLADMGFKLNTYDPCVENKVINEKKCTIIFYVDDNNISHEEPVVVDEIVDILRKKFGNLKVRSFKKNILLE